MRRSLLFIAAPLSSALLFHLGACANLEDGSDFHEDATLPPADASDLTADSKASNFETDATYDAHQWTIEDLFDAGCGTAFANATRDPVVMSVVVDGSGSMDGIIKVGDDLVYDNAQRETDPSAPAGGRDDFFRQDDPKDGALTTLSGKKWLAVRGALNAFYDGIVTSGDTTYTIGGYFFGIGSGKGPDMPSILGMAPLDASQAAALKAQVNPPNYPYNHYTPLVAAIESQVDALQKFSSPNPDAKRILVLLTDGVPTVPGPTTTAALQLTSIKELMDARLPVAAGTPPVNTFVIGVGNPTDATTVYDEEYLGKLAIAGGLPAPGCDANWNQSSPAGSVPCHFQVTPGARTSAQISADLVGAFDSIRTRVASCELTIEKKLGVNIDPSQVNVLYKPGMGAERLVSKEPTNGWSFDNETAPTKVILNGQACADLKSDPKSSVRIAIGCATVTN